MSLNDRKFSSLVEHNKTAAENDLNTGYAQVGAGQYNSSAPTLANLDYGFLQLDSEGKLKTTAAISGDVNVDSNSVDTSGLVGKASGTNGDFITAYASGTTLTCTTLPSQISSITAADIVSIQQVSSTGLVTATFTRDDIVLSATGTDPTTLAITGATFAASDTFVVYTNIARKINQAESEPHDSGDVGNMALAVRQDTLGALAADGEYIPFSTDDEGALYTVDTTLLDVQSTHDDVITSDGLTVVAEAKDFDGSTLPNAVQEGDAVRQTASLSGVQYFMPTVKDGSASAIITHDTAISAGNGGTAGFMGMLDARSSQITPVSSGDAVRPTANINGEQVIAGYTWATQSIRTEEIDPISEKYVTETLATVTNGADATYYYYADMNGFKNFALQNTLNQGSGTVEATVEASLQDDGTAPASCTYIDITSGLTGYTAGTVSAIWNATTVRPYKYVRVKIVADTDAADDGDWTIYFKKLY